MGLVLFANERERVPLFSFIQLGAPCGQTNYHFMERFSSLDRDPECSIPPIQDLLSYLHEDQNSGFYKAGNALHFNNKLNTKFALVSLRELIQLSPLNLDNEQNETALNPANSYKWLYLIHSLASRVISSDKELEKVKNMYMFNCYYRFVLNADINVISMPHFLVGLLSAISRYIDEISYVPQSFITENMYEKLLDLLKKKEFHPITVTISEFSIPNLFSFLSPISVECLPPLDLFKDIDELLHTAIMRLLYRIVLKCPPTSIDEYRNVVQTFCISGLSSQIAQNLLIALFDNNEHNALCFTDTLQYSKLTVDMINCFDSSNGYTKNLPYQTSIILSQSMNSILDVAKAHPDIWCDYIDSHIDVTNALLALLSSEYDPSFHLQSAILLRLGKAKFPDISLPLSLFITSPSRTLRDELSQLLLNQPEVVAPHITECFALVRKYGSQSAPFFKFLNAFLEKIGDTGSILAALLNSLKFEFKKIQLHPNSHLYTQLSNFINVNNTYLDSQPCTICNNPERSTKKYKLNDVKSVVKYTHDTIAVKLRNPLMISALSLSYSIKRPNRTPRTVKIYVSSFELAEPNDLLKADATWRYIGDLSFTRESTQATFSLPISQYASNLKFHFVDFWERSSDGFVLRCPACHTPVPRQSGICPQCHDNAYLCRDCRHINYNHLDGFICCECGSSTYVSMDWNISAVPSFSFTRVSNSEECRAALTKSDELVANAKQIFDRLQQYRNQIEETLSPTNSSQMNEKAVALNLLYNEKCHQQYQELTSIVQHVTAIRTAVASFKNLIGGSSTPNQTSCYNCRATYIRNGLEFLSSVAHLSTIETLEAPSLIISFLDNSIFTSAAVSSLVTFCKVKPELTNRVIDLFKETLPNPSPHLVKLLSELCRINDNYMSNRFCSIMSALKASTEYVTVNGALTPNVLQPLVSSIFSSNIIISTPEQLIMSRVITLWNKKKSKRLDLLDIISNDTLRSLLIDCTSDIIRTTIAKFLVNTSKLSKAHSDHVLNFIYDIITRADHFSHKLGQCINVFIELMKDPTRQRRAFFSGLFDQIVVWLTKETDRVLGLEHSLIFDFSVAETLNFVTRILDLFMSERSYFPFIETKKHDQVVQIITCYFKLRSIIIQRSTYLDDCLTTMKKSFNVFTPLFISTAFDMIPFDPDSVVHEIKVNIFPPTPNIPIIMRKARGQEDFTPGRLPKTPIMSNSIGQHMRDIKTKFCSELRIVGLDDDHGFDLLVNGNIVSFDLKIVDVYRKLWVTAQNETPMIVTVRLQGLDGEATEPMISSFPEIKSEEIDPTVRYSFTKVLCKSGGFKHLLHALSPEYECFDDALLILKTFGTIEENLEMICKLNGISILFDRLRDLFVNGGDSSVISEVLSFLSILVHKDPSSDTNIAQHVSFILENISSDVITTVDSFLKAFLSILPPLASQSNVMIQKVVDFFVEKSLIPKGNIYIEYGSLHMINSFAEFILAVDSNTIREVAFKTPFAQNIAEFLIQLFPLDQSKTSKVWQDSLSTMSLPPALKIMAGMSKGFTQFQQNFLDNDGQIIRLLIELETVTSTASIGELASNVLQCSSTEPSIVAEKISEIRSEKIRIAKERARQEREKALQATKAALSAADFAVLNEMEDNHGWECCICKEGYDFLPDELLGFYAYADLKSDNLCTATHFVCVHKSCHEKSHKAEANHANSKQSLSEWEAASVRNCELPCNTIFPIPSVTLSSECYFMSLQRFYQNSKTSSDMMRMIIKDFSTHLKQLGDGKCTDSSKGGGSLTNDVAFIPFLIYAGICVFDEDKNGQSVLQNYMTRLQKAISENEYVDYMLTLTIWLCSLEEWEEIQLKFLKMTIKTSKANPDKEESAIFEQIKKHLIMFVVIDMIQHTLKCSSDNEIIRKNNTIIIQSQKGHKWRDFFIKTITEDGYEMHNKWIELGEKIEDEVIEIQSIETAFIYINALDTVKREAGDALTWVKQALR